MLPPLAMAEKKRYEKGSSTWGSLCTKSPSMPHTSNVEGFCEYDLYSCLATKILCFGECVGSDVPWIDMFDLPFEQSPGKRKSATSIIFNHELSLWCKERCEFSKDSCGIFQVVEGIRTGDHIEACRCIG